MERHFEKTLTREQVRNIALDFTRKKGYRTDSPDDCKNRCGEWNQQVGLELLRAHGTSTTMLWVRKKNTFLPENHPAVDNGYVFHCFVEVRDDLCIDVTPRQFNERSEEISILSKEEIKRLGWIETH